MSSKDILLLSSTPEIQKLIRDAVSENSCRLITPIKERSGSRRKKISSSLVIVESKDNWTEDLALFHEPIADSCAIIILGSQERLKEDISKVSYLSRLIFESMGAVSERTKEKDISMVDFLEKKISEFVVRMKSAGGKDLYPLLIREIEKCLIRLILKESDGNQVKAAQTLGINRNTLRKKIKELKISLK